MYLDLLLGAQGSSICTLVREQFVKSGGAYKCTTTLYKHMCLSGDTAQGLDLLGREDDPSCGLRCAQCYRSEVRGDAQAGLVLNITTNVEILLVPPV